MNVSGSGTQRNAPPRPAPPPSRPAPRPSSLLPPPSASGRRAPREQGLEVPTLGARTTCPPRPPLSPPRQGSRGPLPPSPRAREPGAAPEPGGSAAPGLGQLRRPRVSGGRRGARAGQGSAGSGRGGDAGVGGSVKGVWLGRLVPGRGGRRGPAGWRGSGAGLPRESWSWGAGCLRDACKVLEAEIRLGASIPPPKTPTNQVRPASFKAPTHPLARERGGDRGRQTGTRPTGPGKPGPSSGQRLGLQARGGGGGERRRLGPLCESPGSSRPALSADSLQSAGLGERAPRGPALLLRTARHPACWGGGIRRR